MYSWSQSGPLKTTVTGVEMFKKILDHGEVMMLKAHHVSFSLIQSLILAISCVQAGDNVGLLLRGLKRGDVERGQVRVPDLVRLVNYKTWETDVHGCLITK